ncbi:MAG: type II toxin-antitoxin system RelE/ParE family toxin [Bacteroidales bacterium]|nr:type II toxin-antitoxin system RelE/ParE family toxin [Bacteroidales bacterium]
MGLTVYWTHFAENKLDDIYTYYKEKSGTRIARKLVDEIVNKTLELEKNPLIGQKELLLSHRIQEFRYLVYKSYKIIYLVNIQKKRIEVFNLFDCRQNPIKIDEI